MRDCAYADAGFIRRVSERRYQVLKLKRRKEIFQNV
jgi:hypothetical protein